MKALEVQTIDVEKIHTLLSPKLCNDKPMLGLLVQIEAAEKTKREDKNALKEHQLLCLRW